MQQQLKFAHLIALEMVTVRLVTVIANKASQDKTVHNLPVRTTATITATVCLDNATVLLVGMDSTAHTVGVKINATTKVTAMLVLIDHHVFVFQGSAEPPVQLALLVDGERMVRAALAMDPVIIRNAIAIRATQVMTVHKKSALRVVRSRLCAVGLVSATPTQAVVSVNTPISASLARMRNAREIAPGMGNATVMASANAKKGSMAKTAHLKTAPTTATERASAISRSTLSAKLLLLSVSAIKATGQPKTNQTPALNASVSLGTSGRTVNSECASTTVMQTKGTVSVTEPRSHALVRMAGVGCLVSSKPVQTCATTTGLAMTVSAHVRMIGQASHVRSLLRSAPTAAAAMALVSTVSATVTTVGLAKTATSLPSPPRAKNPSPRGRVSCAFLPALITDSV